MLLAATIALTLGQTCAFDARWRMPIAFPVPLSDGTPWATLTLGGDPRGPKTKVVLGPDGVATARIKANGLELRFTANDFPVTAKPLTFAEVFTTSAETPLWVLRVRGDEVDVVPAPREDLRPATPWTASTVRCDSLALGAQPWRLDSHRALVAPVPVSATRDGTPRVSLVHGATMSSELGAGEPAHVTFTLRDGARLTGWTTNGAPVEARDGRPGWDFEGDLGKPERPATPRRCQRALRLSASRGDRSEDVGTLDARMGFFTRRTEDGRVIIEPEQPWLRLLDGWALTIAAADLRACADDASVKPPPAQLDQQ